MSRIGNLKCSNNTKTATIKHLGLIEITEINNHTQVNIKYLKNKSLVQNLIDLFIKYGYDNIVTDIESNFFECR